MSLMFLKLGDEIKGESTDSDHKEWIEVLSFSWSVNQPVSQASGTGGRTSSGVMFTDLTCMKTVDKSTADIMKFCAKGTHIPRVELEVVQDTGDKNTYLKYEMEDVVLSSVAPSGDSGGGKPVEQLGMSFGKFKQTYTPTDHKGAPGTPMTRGWDLEINKEWQ